MRSLVSAQSLLQHAPQCVQFLVQYVCVGICDPVCSVHLGVHDPVCSVRFAVCTPMCSVHLSVQCAPWHMRSHVQCALLLCSIPCAACTSACATPCATCMLVCAIPCAVRTLVHAPPCVLGSRTWRCVCAVCTSVHAIPRGACILARMIPHAACILACAVLRAACVWLCGALRAALRSAVCIPTLPPSSPAVLCSGSDWRCSLWKSLAGWTIWRRTKRLRGVSVEALLRAQTPQQSLMPSGDAASLQEQTPCSCASPANTKQDSVAVCQLVLQDLSPGWERASQQGELGAAAPADPCQ